MTEEKKNPFVEKVNKYKQAIVSIVGTLAAGAIALAAMWEQIKAAIGPVSQ